MIADITQTTKIRKEYRAGSKPLEVSIVKRYSKSGSEYTTTHFSCDIHNMGTHIDVMRKDIIIENERLIGEGIKFDVSMPIIFTFLVTKYSITSIDISGCFAYFSSSSKYLSQFV